MGNIVPRLSTWSLTPISNISAAGAIITSAIAAWANNFLVCGEVPASMQD